MFFTSRIFLQVSLNAATEYLTIYLATDQCLSQPSKQERQVVDAQFIRSRLDTSWPVFFPVLFPIIVSWFCNGLVVCSYW